jgi:peptide/nickel transport system permease protein
MTPAADRSVLHTDPEPQFALVSSAAPDGADTDAEGPVAPPSFTPPLVGRAVGSPRAKVAGPGLEGALFVTALGVIGVLVACSVLPDALAPYRATDMQTEAILLAPQWHHPLGTDQFGRDVLSLIVYGARQSLVLAFFATIVACSVGAFLGLSAGYAGGPLDMAVMRVVDAWMAIPSMLLAIAVCTALGSSVSTMVLAVSTSLAPRYARVLRAQAISVRSRGFVEAARASGASHAAILRGHILPHCVGPILVIATIGAGWAIIIGSSLSFLGFGVSDDHPDWAYLIAQGRGYVTVAWWTVTFPGLAIAAFVVATNLLGDALRRRLDPRSTGR